MKLTIPKTFELAGRTWKVRRVKRIKDAYGKCRASRCIIELSDECSDGPELMHTFLHELLHAVAYTRGDKKGFFDEYRIDSTSALLLQALTTAK